MRIAIVDDIAAERDNLKTRLNAQLARLSLDAEVFSFACGTDFILKNGEKIPVSRDLAKAASQSTGTPPLRAHGAVDGGECL